MDMDPIAIPSIETPNRPPATQVRVVASRPE
jgi:hypothetical protein